MYIYTWNKFLYLYYEGARGSIVGWGAMLQARRLRVQVPVRSLDFFQLTQSFQLHYGPGVDSASDRNEYRELIK
jgi:hypothetical protein